MISPHMDMRVFNLGYLLQQDSFIMKVKFGGSIFYGDAQYNNNWRLAQFKEEISIKFVPSPSD